MEVKTLLQTVVEIFKEGTKHHSFLQYFWIKEELLSTMEAYQTKIISFIESGQQTDKGAMIFQTRNSHNNKPLGTGHNHPDIDIAEGIPQNLQPTINLSYGSYRHWKTLLGVNSFDDKTTSTVKPSSSVKHSHGDI